MVVNILNPTEDMSSALLYNEGKVVREAAQILSVSNIPGNTIEDISRTFESYEHRNIRSKDVSFHLSIDPLKGQDRMTDEDIVRFSDRLMERLGYGNQPYVVYKHDDIKRTHYHIVSIRVDGNGKKINDYQERSKCFQICRDLEKEFDFKMGNADKMKSKKFVDRFDQKQSDVTGQMKALCEECLTYNFTTFSQFQTILEYHGIWSENITGIRTRMVLQGLDAKGHTSTKKIPESAIGLELYKLYSERALHSVDWMKVMETERFRIRSIAKNPLQDATSQDHFRNILRKHGIDVRIYRDPSTREITGADFIDHVTKCAFRVSELEPELSLEKLHEADTERWGNGNDGQEFDLGLAITIGDLLSGLGGKPSKSHEKDIKDNPKKKKTKLKF